MAPVSYTHLICILEFQPLRVEPHIKDVVFGVHVTCTFEIFDRHGVAVTSVIEIVNEFFELRLGDGISIRVL